MSVNQPVVQSNNFMRGSDGDDLCQMKKSKHTSSTIYGKMFNAGRKEQLKSIVLNRNPITHEVPVIQVVTNKPKRNKILK